MSTSDKKFKVFVSYHKPATLMELPFVINMHSGRDCSGLASKDGVLSPKDSSWLLEHTTGDNTGDNISNLNRNFCELTSLYWIWKNFDLSNIDYIGFVQYRRQFIFDEAEFDQSRNGFEEESFSIKRYPYINRGYLKKIGFDKPHIEKIIENYEAVFPYPGNLARAGMSSIWQDYAMNIPGMHIDDLNVLTEVYKEKYPEYYEAFLNYLSSHEKYMYLMFFMKTELFLNYCDYLFDILFEVHRRIDVSLYTPNGKRTIGFLGEFVYGFFIKYILKDFRVKNFSVSLVENV